LQGDACMLCQKGLAGWQRQKMHSVSITFYQQASEAAEICVFFLYLSLFLFCLLWSYIVRHCRHEGPKTTTRRRGVWMGGFFQNFSTTVPNSLPNMQTKHVMPTRHHSF
jgi:hypothetical protein